jgi:hypothetical protein
MWGSMVVLIPSSGVARAATAVLARALDGVRFVVVERSPSPDTARRADTGSDADADLTAEPATEPEIEAEAIARQLAAGVPADRLIIVGQGDGAQTAIELARRLEGAGNRDGSAGPRRVDAVVIAAALPRPADDAQNMADPIAAPLHVWAGTEDLSAPAGQRMLGWREYTDAPTTFRVFDGSEDFLLTQVDEVAERLWRVLAARSVAEVLDVF